jgi:hypothetical protein
MNYDFQAVHEILEASIERVCKRLMFASQNPFISLKTKPKQNKHKPTKQKTTTKKHSQVLMAHSYNPSYSGGRDQ